LRQKLGQLCFIGAGAAPMNASHGFPRMLIEPARSGYFPVL
jgi:hypothetical protein